MLNKENARVGGTTTGADENSRTGTYNVGTTQNPGNLPLVIQHRRAYYVLYDHERYYKHTAGELRVVFGRTPRDLMRAFGAVAVHVEYELCRRVPEWDGRTLKLPALSWRDLEPVYSSRVATWLAGFGDAVAAWCVDVTALDRAAPALYVRGDPDAAWVLAEGLAAIWRARVSQPPGNWTAEPIVLADGYLPPRWCVNDATRVKAHGPMQARGAKRVILTSRKGFTPEPSGNVLRVDVERRPWDPIEPDEIARHVLWLAREVA